MKKNVSVISIVISLLTIGCTLSSIQDATISRKSVSDMMFEDKSKQYPKFNIEFGSFFVVNAPLNESNPSQIILDSYQKLTPEEKRVMLNHLDTVRFIVNTSEFSNKVVSAKLRASRTGSGSMANINFGDVYDSKRVYKLIQDRKYKLSIHKDMVADGIIAVGVIGEFLYVLNDNDPRTSNSYWIAFPNNLIWTNSRYTIFPNTEIPSTILHEILHNTGFSHGLEKDDDTVYIIDKIFDNLQKDKSFIAKYKSELDKFRPFYEDKYKTWLKSDTLSYNASIAMTVNYSTYNADDNIEDIYKDYNYCAIYTDGTHNIYSNEVLR